MNVLVFGNSNADINVKPVEGLHPDVDTTFVDTFELTSGGNAMTTSMVLRKLGVNCSLATYMGGSSDLFSKFLTDRLVKAGVDTSLIKKVEGNTCGLVVVMISSSGKRFFLYKKGVQDIMELDQHVIDNIPNYDIVSIHGTYLMPRFDGAGTARLFRESKKLNKTTVLDVAPDNSGKWMETIADALKYCDYFIPSIIEARGLTGEDNVEKMAELLLEKGPSVIIIKLGESGCYYNDNNSSGYVPAYNIKAIDTTGAGDCFCGGFISTLDKQMDLESRLRFASAVAAISCMNIGATGGIESTDQVNEFMRLQSQY